MNLDFVCEFCNSTFSNKSNLSVHKKRTKRCLVIQNSLNVNELFKCEKCNKTFTSKQNLNDHQGKCSQKIELLYNNLLKKYNILEKKLDISKIQNQEKDKQFSFIKKENEELKNQIKDLQDKLSEVANIGAKKDTTSNTYRVNNNIINQLVPYDLDRNKIRMIIDEKFTENHLYAKENGIANFAVANLLKDDEGNLKLTCTDTARKIFIYKDNNGNIYKDPNAINFTEMYIPEVKRKSYEIISDKDDESEIIELTECVTNIEPTSVTNKLIGKLVPKK